jgi:hypothetical protein
MVFRIGQFMIPLRRLQRVSVIANLMFSLAVACLMFSVIAFALPTRWGLVIASVVGLGTALEFIWENMVPLNRARRQRQLSEEMLAGDRDPSSSNGPQALASEPTAQPEDTPAETN